MISKKYKNILLGFLISLLVLFLPFFHNQESRTIFGCTILKPENQWDIITDKTKIESIPFDLLLFQNQLLPYNSNENYFFLPFTEDGTNRQDILSTAQYGKIYLLDMKEDGSDTSFLPSIQTVMPVLVVDNDVYFETSIVFTNKTIISFQSESFQNSNAYGYFTCYSPYDTDVGTYSVKSSYAKLRYETENALTLRENRSYTLKLQENGVQNKLALCGLRKDDDWELDPLGNNKEQIISFFELWNRYCIEINEKRFIIQYEIVDLYMDDDYIGEFLLKVPLDDKQLQSSGIRPTAPSSDNILYSDEIASFFYETGLENEYDIESTVLLENGIIFALPKRIMKQELEIGTE